MKSKHKTKTPKPLDTDKFAALRAKTYASTRGHKEYNKEMKELHKYHSKQTELKAKIVQTINLQS